MKEGIMLKVNVFTGKKIAPMVYNRLSKEEQDNYVDVDYYNKMQRRQHIDYFEEMEKMPLLRIDE